MRRLLARALNKNQLLILSEVNRRSDSISSLLIGMSDKHGIPLSSLKLNSKILRELGLIEVSKQSMDYGVAVLSEDGRFIIDLINDA